MSARPRELTRNTQHRAIDSKHSEAAFAGGATAMNTSSDSIVMKEAAFHAGHGNQVRKQVRAVPKTRLFARLSVDGILDLAKGALAKRAPNVIAAYSLHHGRASRPAGVKAAWVVVLESPWH